MQPRSHGSKTGRSTSELGTEIVVAEALDVPIPDIAGCIVM